jgi:medium-chain acyl-[acyl-carrier-protein] hydrolase
MDIYSQDFTVTLSDVGENNALTNKGILRMLQEIACVHSSLVAFGINDSATTGFSWILLNWKLQVFARPIWNTKLKVSTWCSKHTLIAFYRDFEVLDSDNNLIAIATSKWVLFDINKNGITKLNDEIKAKYTQQVNKHVFDVPMLEKLKEPENNEFVREYTVQRRDIDTNHHINNLNYLDFAYEAIPDDIFSHSDFKNVEIMYKHEAKLGDTLNLFYTKQKDSIFVTIKNKKTDKLHCILKLY